MKKLIFTLLTLGLSLVANAQVWQQVGGGLTYNTVTNFIGREITAASQGNKTYVVYVDTSDNLRVQVWNGLAWSAFPDIIVSGWNQASQITDMEVTPSGVVYVSMAITSNVSWLLRFQNQSWIQMLNPTFSGALLDLEYHNSRLYMAGNFVDPTTGIQNTCYLDSTTYVNLPNQIIGGKLDSISTITHIDNDLYITGRSVGDTVPVKILDSANSNWTSVANFAGNFGQGSQVSFALYKNPTNGDLNFLHRTNTSNYFRLFRIQGSNAILQDTIFYAGGYDSDYHLALHDSTLFLLAESFEANGNSALFDVWNSNFTKVVGLPANPRAISALSSPNRFFIFSDSAAYDPQLYPNNMNYAYLTTNGFSRFYGHTYEDVNTNCQFDAGDISIPGHMMELNQGGNVFTVVSNDQGDFSFVMPSGVYNVVSHQNILPMYQYLNTTCSLPNSISLTPNLNFRQDIALEHDQTIDATISLESYTGIANFGFPALYKIDITNPGEDINGLINVKLTVPSAMDYMSANPLPNSSLNNEYSFNINGLKKYETTRIDVELRVNTARSFLGDIVCPTVLLSGITGDADLSNNADTLCMTVVGAYDPNDKTPSAEQISPSTNQIDYRIRFQNTGTFPATKVTIIDTLDLTLPVTAIIMNSASHPYSISVQNNILIWEFNNIMLPDSASDPLGSQGFVSFSSGLNPGLGIGDSIFNNAEIYFDYQPPIHTNKATTAIIANFSLEGRIKQNPIKLYPNPASNIIYIELEEEVPSTRFDFFDINGKLIKSFTVNPDERFELEATAFAKGVYTLRSSYNAQKIILK